MVPFNGGQLYRQILLRLNPMLVGLHRPGKQTRSDEQFPILSMAANPWKFKMKEFMSDK